MGRIRVKICGVTRVEDGIAAAELGVDAVGLNFYPQSSRFISAALAAEIVSALPPFVTTVGLFLDASVEEVCAVSDVVALDLLQFHGDEDPAFCASFARPFIKAVPMRIGADVSAYAHDFEAAQALLLDSHGDGVIGGTGKPFDWSKIPDKLDKPMLLAGGLSPSNISEAVQQIKPYGVDICSGVESAKGIKDHELMRELMRNLG